MAILENILVREQEEVNNEIKKLEALEQSVVSLQEHKIAGLEKAFQSSDSFMTEAVESKRDIQCIVDRIREFEKKRQFYHLIHATDSVIEKIEKHQKEFPHELLERDLFEQIRVGLKAHSVSLQVMKAAFQSLNSIDSFSQLSSTKKLQNWAEHLERLGEALEDTILFFSREQLDKIAALCESAILEARKKGEKQSPRNNKKEEWRRRIRYAAGFILNIIEALEEDAIEEEQEIRREFLLLSQSSFKTVWD
jgi:hypothetical protein